VSCLHLVIVLNWLHCLTDTNIEGNLEKHSAGQTGNITHGHSSKDSPAVEGRPGDKEGSAWGTTVNATDSDLPNGMPLDEDESSGQEYGENMQTVVDGEHHGGDDHSGTHVFGSDKDESSEHDSSKSWQAGADKEHQNISAWGSTGNATESDFLEGMPLDEDAASKGEPNRNAGNNVYQEHHREDDNSATHELGGDETGRPQGCKRSQRHSKEKSRKLRGHGGSQDEDEAAKQGCEEEDLGLWGILGIVGAGLAAACVCSTLACWFCCKKSTKFRSTSTTNPIVVGIPACMGNDVELKA